MIRTRHDLLPTKNPTNLQIAWAAGIFEGEGYITLMKHTTRVAVSQKDPWLLYELRSLFGGNVNGPYPHKNGSHHYAWDITGARARGFAYTIYKFLSPRRRIQIIKSLD